ncbi:MAG: response regulator [Hyphomicrobiaceae bacterium]
MARILLADDDAATRDLVRRALELDGHTVTTADDGADAQARLAASGPFDVLVTDIQMPGIDGIALSKGALAANPKLKVVLMSAHADVLDSARTLNLAGVRLLSKPFPIDRMRGEVRASLNQ